MTGPDLLHQLKALADLPASGAITAEEFARAKARVLNVRTAIRTARDHMTGVSDMVGSVSAPAPISGVPARYPLARANSPQPDSPAANKPAADRPAGDPQAPNPPVPNPPAPTAAPLTAIPLGSPLNPETAAVAGQGPLAPLPVQRSQADRPRIADLPRWPREYAVAGGGLLALLAFFAMPLATFPFFGSLTGPGVPALSSEVGALALLWIVPLAGATVVGIGGWQSLAPVVPPSPHRRGSIVAAAAAAVGILVYIVALIAVQSQLSNNDASQLGVSGTTFIGAGFWTALIGLMMSGVVAVLDITGTTIGGYASGSSAE